MRTVSPHVNNCIRLPFMVQPEIESYVLVRGRYKAAVVESVVILQEASGRLGHEPDISETHCRNYNILSGFVLIDHEALILRKVFSPGFSPFLYYLRPQIFRNFRLKPFFVGLHGYEVQSPFGPVFYHFIHDTPSPGASIDTLCLHHFHKCTAVIRNSGDFISAFIHLVEKVKHALSNIEVTCPDVVFS